MSASISATEFRIVNWIGPDGNKHEEYRLADYESHFKIIFCFQHWCPGCHSAGFPNLQKLYDTFKNDQKFMFFAIQTVFEGHKVNSFDKLRENQLKYKLPIPFGQDEGIASGHELSTLMQDYKTRGTPWFLFIDENNKVLFSDFHINIDAALIFLKSRKS